MDAVHKTKKQKTDNYYFYRITVCNYYNSSAHSFDAGCVLIYHFKVVIMMNVCMFLETSSEGSLIEFRVQNLSDEIKNFYHRLQVVFVFLKIFFRGLKDYKIKLLRTFLRHRKCV